MKQADVSSGVFGFPDVPLRPVPVDSFSNAIKKPLRDPEPLWGKGNHPTHRVQADPGRNRLVNGLEIFATGRRNERQIASASGRCNRLQFDFGKFAGDGSDGRGSLG